MEKRSLLFIVCVAAAVLLVNFLFGPSLTHQESTASSPQKIAPLPIAEKTPMGGSSFEQKEIANTQFFVLENGFQQLVFSNQGGALSEINLKLESKENPSDAIRPIRLDKIFEKEFAPNDSFPLFPFSIVQEEKVVHRDKGGIGGYYPLLRRSLLATSHTPFFSPSPLYYSLNVVSASEEDKEALYRVKRFEKDLIVFERKDAKRTITKTFSLPQNPEKTPYCFDLTIDIEGDTDGLWLTSGVPEVELIGGNPAPSLKYRYLRSGKFIVEEMSLPKSAQNLVDVRPEWICTSNGFFGIIVDPLTPLTPGVNAQWISGDADRTRLTLVDAAHNRYPADKYPGYQLQLPLFRASSTHHFRIFAGPFDQDILKKVDAAFSDPSKGYNPQYTASQDFHGWFSFISEPFARFLFLLMQFFYQISHSWGISIILLTIALRIMLYPLNAWSIRSSLKMQEIAPQVSAIQERNKKDPKKAQREVINLYKEKGVNPMTGCFPLLIQMPFLIGMFDLLKSAFDLRGATFIPGWIDNLTAPDVLFSWGTPIFFFGTDFHLLPFLLGAAMLWQQKFSTSSKVKGKEVLSDQQKQQKTMGNIMAVVFTVLFYHFASGLNLYWLSSMLLGILQQWYMMRKK